MQKKKALSLKSVKSVAIGSPGNAGGLSGPKTVKEAQSDPNYVSRLLLDCVANVCRGREGGAKNYSYATAWNERVRVTERTLLTLLLTLCGLTSRKTHRGGLGLGGSVHEEAHPCFPCLVQPSFKGIDSSSNFL